jgi:hypothetical protein
MTKLERLDDLLQRDPRSAKIKISKHLDGDLLIAPSPSHPGERARIAGQRPLRLVRAE